MTVGMSIGSIFCRMYRSATSQFGKSFNGKSSSKDDGNCDK